MCHLFISSKYLIAEAVLSFLFLLGRNPLAIFEMTKLLEIDWKRLQKQLNDENKHIRGENIPNITPRQCLFSMRRIDVTELLVLFVPFGTFDRTRERRRPEHFEAENCFGLLVHDAFLGRVFSCQLLQLHGIKIGPLYKLHVFMSPKRPTSVPRRSWPIVGLNRQDRMGTVPVTHTKHTLACLSSTLFAQDGAVDRCYQ